MAPAVKKRKAKAKCCVSKPRCKRCPVRLKAEAQRKGRKRKKKHR